MVGSITTAGTCGRKRSHFEIRSQRAPGLRLTANDLLHREPRVPPKNGMEIYVQHVGRPCHHRQRRKLGSYFSSQTELVHIKGKAITLLEEIRGAGDAARMGEPSHDIHRALGSVSGTTQTRCGGMHLSSQGRVKARES